MRRSSVKRERSYSGSDNFSSDYGRSDRRKGDPKKVYVSNVTFDASYTELRDHFLSAGDVTSLQMLKDSDNRFKGCCVVSYKDNSMADKAIDTLNRSDFKGRKLVVKEESANPEHRSGGMRKKHRIDDQPPPPRTIPTQPSTMDTYGLSMQFLNSVKIDLPLVNAVFVANFGYDVTDENLKDVFSIAGKIKDYEVFKDKDGNSRGFGIVEYEHPVEAVQAISMLHNQSYRDRVLVVRMDRSEKKRESKLRLPLGLKSVGMGLGPDGAPLKDVTSLPAIALANQMGNIAPMGATAGLMGGQMAPAMGGGLMDGLMNRQNPFGNQQMPVPNRQFEPNSQFPSRGNLGLGNIIQISNLPMDFTSDDLHKLCWSYGDVVSAEMRSNGVGMAKFSSEIEARRTADQLDMQSYKGARLVASVL